MLGQRKRHVLWLPIALVCALSFFGAHLLKSDFAWPNTTELFWRALAVFVFIKLGVFAVFRLHSGNWRQASIFDLTRVVGGCVVAMLLTAIVTVTTIGPVIPRSIFVMDALLCMVLVGALQLSVRLFREVLQPTTAHVEPKKCVLIYGAGIAGAQLAKEIRMHPSWGASVCGFLDDDESKRGSIVVGLPVVGTGRDAASYVARSARKGRQITEIVIAMPMATGEQMRSALANCRAAGVSVRTLPSITELLEGKVIRQIREVSPEDLLGRDPVNIEEGKIGDALTGKVVLVTGGCGSIGSEVCRQVARFEPRKLIVFDQSESEAFMLAMSLRGWYPGIDLQIEIGDVVAAQRVDEVMSKHGVDVVFHAAAYKHVPLMEAHILEAVNNNVIGTYNVALAAQRHSVQRFVLISTDKAVNPTSVMGLTKRVAELLVSAMPLDGGAKRTKFASVRFGNVLGSSGSVVQIFRRQIAAGGPVTITHPDMRRYFMSITEAVQLVLQASVMASGSEIFVLDMGQPVLIMELARNMIRLAGFTPGEDIEIRTTGLRPGEKLFEEVQLHDENHLPTQHEKIARFSCRTLGAAYLTAWMDELRALIRSREPDALLDHMKLIVPEYQDTRKRTGHAERKEVASMPAS